MAVRAEVFRKKGEEAMPIERGKKAVLLMLLGPQSSAFQGPRRIFVYNNPPLLFKARKKRERKWLSPPTTFS